MIAIFQFQKSCTDESEKIKSFDFFFLLDDLEISGDNSFSTGFVHFGLVSSHHILSFDHSQTPLFRVLLSRWELDSPQSWQLLWPFVKYSVTRSVKQ